MNILLVDDSRGDVLLTREAFRDAHFTDDIHVASDGVEAMSFLRKQGRYASAPRPDLILLDLNMPRKDGREVLSEIKSDPGLRTIPVVVLTTSDAERDVDICYGSQCNCYVTKPVVFDEFLNIIRSIHSFWTSAELPDHVTGRAETVQGVHE